MKSLRAQDRLHIHSTLSADSDYAHHLNENFSADILKGLSASKKYIPPMYLYDEKGSQLFEKICDLDEYYLTRAEAALLNQNAREIAEKAEGINQIVELGSGSSTKTKTLIRAFLKLHPKLTYSPIDISRSILVESSKNLLKEFKSLTIHAYADEYTNGLKLVGENITENKVFLLLGSNLGNMEVDQSVIFLKLIHDHMHPGDFLLLGSDLQKDPVTIEAAYNDAKGVTKAFNLNLLDRINRELSGCFNKDQFDFKSVYNEGAGRCESYLVSRVDQTVPIKKLNRDFYFKQNEWIHTEHSQKFTPEMIQDMAERAGLKKVFRWEESQLGYQMHLLSPISK